MTNKKESPAKIIGIVSKALKYGPKIVKAIKKTKKVTPKKTDVKLVKTKTKKPTITKPKVTKTKVTKPKVTKTKTTTTTKKTTGKVDKRSKAWRDETNRPLNSFPSASNIGTSYLVLNLRCAVPSYSRSLTPLLASLSASSGSKDKTSEYLPVD